MTTYQGLFRIRFIGGLQYRVAAWSGIATQLVWGILEILMFRAFYESNPTSFPMTFQSVVSYIWLQQAFLSLYMIWFWENDIFESIENGNIAYELVRPIKIYNMWFVRSLATRLSKTVLRCLPVLLIALLIPAPYKLVLPSSIEVTMIFLLTMCLSLLVIISMNMIIYFLTFFTINGFGIRMVFQSVGELLTGSILPLPFFPNQLGKLIRLLPFASIQNVPFRVYSGDLAGEALKESVLLQITWIGVLVLLGKVLEQKAIKQVTVQGG